MRLVIALILLLVACGGRSTPDPVHYDVNTDRYEVTVNGHVYDCVMVRAGAGFGAIGGPVCERREP
jgi:hypothetical protein